jgi:predicted small metal-binding protein
MKTMTCKQLGGPCGYLLHGSTADEIIKSGEIHVREMAAKGDAEHQKITDMMDAMRKNPASGMDWYNKFKQEFAAHPED